MDKTKIILLNAIFILSFLLGIKIYAKLNQGPVSNWIWKDAWYEGYTPYSKIPPTDNQPEDENIQIKADSFPEALELSQKHDKEMLILFSADWCHWCKELKSKTFTDARVEEELKKYILLIIDIEKDAETPKLFDVRGLPTIVVSDSSGKSLKQKSGMQKPEDLISWLNHTSFLTFLLF